jgi:hypothetical protein
MTFFELSFCNYKDYAYSIQKIIYGEYPNHR